MRKLLLFVTVVCLPASSFASEWQSMGPRALAMGGAGVALPQGPNSAYWNTATLGLADNPSGFQVPIGAKLGISGTVLQGANDLNQLNKDCEALSSNCNQANIDSAFANLNNPNNGVRGGVIGGVGLKVGRLGLFTNNITEVGAKPRMDTTNTTPLTIQNNASTLDMRGLNVTEFGAAYGHELPIPGLHAGVALKGMIGQVGYERFSVINGEAGNGALDQFNRNTKNSFQPGVDAGLLWDVAGSFENAWWQPRLGISGRNLNNPKFKNADAAIAAGEPAKVSLQGGLRAGVSISPFKFWHVAADADLTRNLTALEGVHSQQVGLGTEINVFNRSWLNIPLRAGLAKNVADPSSRTMLSAGFGLNFLYLNVDLGVQSTPRDQTIQSQGQNRKIPREVAVSGQVAFLFGGAPAAAAETLASEKAPKAKKAK